MSRTRRDRETQKVIPVAGHQPAIDDFQVSPLRVFEYSESVVDLKAKRIPSTYQRTFSPGVRRIELGIAASNLVLNLSILGLQHSIYDERLPPVGMIKSPPSIVAQASAVCRPLGRPLLADRHPVNSGHLHGVRSRQIACPLFLPASCPPSFQGKICASAPDPPANSGTIICRCLYGNIMVSFRCFPSISTSAYRGFTTH